jgi:hypothetical protein
MCLLKFLNLMMHDDLKMIGVVEKPLEDQEGEEPEEVATRKFRKTYQQGIGDQERNNDQPS